MTLPEKGEDVHDVETKEPRGPGTRQVVGDFICPAATWHPDFFFQVKELEMKWPCDVFPLFPTPLKDFGGKIVMSKVSQLPTLI